VAVLLAGALAWKWQLGVRRVVAAVALMAALVGLAVTQLVDGAWTTGMTVAGGTLAVAGAVLAQRFYRDPERRPPAGADLVLSPADGEVVYVRRSVAGALPVATKHGRDHRLDELVGTGLVGEEAVVVGVAMSFLDVHVNRAPVAGLVTARRHQSGSFLSLRRPEAVFQNERATTVISTGSLDVAVVQIASRLVRQVVGYVGEGDRVAAGDRIGAIRLGSQVDLVLPARPDVQVLVRPGDRVRAGESALARVDATALTGSGTDRTTDDAAGG